MHHTLPPIRELHPGLPLPSPMPLSPTAASGSGHGHMQLHSYPVASGSTLGLRRSVDDSDAEGDAQEPPKKKRRRQALSCTECKRRKIKCDRAQPCGPCTRRGEPSKCQWHIIEPMEKYVTRAEYDELKTKVNDLESMVHRLTAGALPARMAGHAPVSSGPVSRVESIQGTAITPYHAAPPPSMPSSIYHTMPPSRPLPGRSESSSHLHRQSRHTAVRSPSQSSRPSTSQGSSQQAVAGPSPATEPPYYPPSPHASTSVPSTPIAGPSGPVSSRRASLSVAAMTNPIPYQPDSRPLSPPKKYTAQTPPPPGQRLRREHLIGSAPASHLTHHPPYPRPHHTLLRSPVEKPRASLIPA
ncbi:hypothetical protein FOMPIDRAFT_1133696 [Fomitopsis schrenkii]|uniref:Zn(2)-C6 fungal-type domain-containing protein n=1 Tax=Fomitopsis schrenkii TaxID=2126942 RepID=S8DQ24_FOMSC|nr:hypothetical protein FOMPIDRAFT_1133696 [Fomitopsis schrenkii]